MKKRENGITLLSLVITIIVLIILASISVYSGIDTIRSAKLTKFTTEMKIMQLKINELYDSYINNGSVTVNGVKYVGNGQSDTANPGVQTIGKSISQAPQKKLQLAISGSGVTITADKGYMYYDTEIIKALGIDDVEEEFFVSIPERTIVSVEGFDYLGTIYYTLEQLPDGLYNVAYNKVENTLNIGDYVSYIPSGTYTWQAKYCSSPESAEYTDKILDSSKDDYKIDTWRVLDVDKETGDVTLVPQNPTNYIYGKGLLLRCKQGYNNAVYLLNEACSNLYSDKSKGITARSINMDDIEGKMTKEALARAHEYRYSENSPKYGEQVLNMLRPAYYPSIYEKEILSVVNGSKNETGIGRSEQTNLIEPTKDSIPGDGPQAVDSIQPYQTHWWMDSADMKTAFKEASNGVNYYDLLLPQGNTTVYWIASRSINTHVTVPANGNFQGTATFGVQSIFVGQMNCFGMSSSDDTAEGAAYGLFPIVSLNIDQIELCTGKNSESNMHQIR